MYIVFVKHTPNGKSFIFDSNGYEDQIKAGTNVICETMLGNKTGVAEYRPLSMKNTDGSDFVMQKLGAYLPLKKIIGVFEPAECLSDDEQRRIAVNWLRQRIIDGSLPF